MSGIGQWASRPESWGPNGDLSEKKYLILGLILYRRKMFKFVGRIEKFPDSNRKFTARATLFFGLFVLRTSSSPKIKNISCLFMNYGFEVCQRPLHAPIRTANPKGGVAFGKDEVVLFEGPFFPSFFLQLSFFRIFLE